MPSSTFECTWAGCDRVFDKEGQLERHERTRTVQTCLRVEVRWLTSDQMRVRADILVRHAERSMQGGKTHSGEGYQ